MLTKPFPIQHSMILDISFGIDSMLFRTLRFYKDCLHHRCFICIILLIGWVNVWINEVVVDVLHIQIHCFKKEDKLSKFWHGNFAKHLLDLVTPRMAPVGGMVPTVKGWEVGQRCRQSDVTIEYHEFTIEVLQGFDGHMDDIFKVLTRKKVYILKEDIKQGKNNEYVGFRRECVWIMVSKSYPWWRSRCPQSSPNIATIFNHI